MGVFLLRVELLATESQWLSPFAEFLDAERKTRKHLMKE